MGRIYRATYSYGGATKTAEAWSIEFKDHTGHRRRLTAFTDRRLSDQLLGYIERVVDCRRANAPLPPDLAGWVERVTPDLRDRLASWGVLDPARVAACHPLLSHLEDWRRFMAADGCDPRHVADSAAMVRRALASCRFVLWSDIQPGKVQSFMAELTILPKKEPEEGEEPAPRRPASARTKNAHLVAIKSFLNWMVSSGRAHSNPIKHMSRMPAAPVRERRPLEVAEFQRFIRATRAGRWFRMSGQDRAAIYLLAAQTGLRWSEIAALTRASFHFDAMPPSVFLPGTSTKNGKDAAIPLLPELVELLRPRLSLMLPDAPAFPMPADRDGADMVRLDLEAAGLPERDGAGRVFDFHALRHQFGTMLAQANTPIKTAMELMRHSDVNLTMGLYSHVLLGDAAGALAKMPQLDVPEEQQKLAASAEISGVIPATDSSQLRLISQVRTDGNAVLPHGMNCSIKQKSPGNAGVSALPGPVLNGERDGTRTRNLQIDSQDAINGNAAPGRTLRILPDSSRSNFCQEDIKGLLLAAARAIESRRDDPALVARLVRAAEGMA